MVKRTSAEIIPFPVAPSATPFYIPAPLPPGDRLSTALDSLSIALAEQRLAVQRWHAAVAELTEAMRSLSFALPNRDSTEPHAS